MAKTTERKKRQPISKRLTKRKAGRPRKPVVPVIPEGLTAKEARFVEEYCVDLNASRAARAAGYSKHSAKEIGYENLTKPHIAAAVQDWKRRLSERTDITKEEIIGNLVPLARANMLDYSRVTEDGDLVHDFTGMTRDKGAAMQELEVHEYMDGRGEDAREVKRTKFKLYDRRASNIDLAKLLGLITDKTEHSGDVTVTTKEDAEAKARKKSTEQLEADVAAWQEAADKVAENARKFARIKEA